jgi:hypothetical protein
MPKLIIRKILALALPNLTKRSLKEKGTSTDPFATLEFKGKLIHIVKSVYIAYRLHPCADGLIRG